MARPQASSGGRSDGLRQFLSERSLLAIAPYLTYRGARIASRLASTGARGYCAARAGNSFRVLWVLAVTSSSLKCACWYTPSI